MERDRGKPFPEGDGVGRGRRENHTFRGRGRGRAGGSGEGRGRGCGGERGSERFKRNNQRGRGTWVGGNHGAPFSDNDFQQNQLRCNDFAPGASNFPQYQTMYQPYQPTPLMSLEFTQFHARHPPSHSQTMHETQYPQTLPDRNSQSMGSNSQRMGIHPQDSIRPPQYFQSTNNQQQNPNRPRNQNPEPHSKTSLLGDFPLQHFPNMNTLLDNNPNHSNPNRYSDQGNSKFNKGRNGKLRNNRVQNRMRNNDCSQSLHGSNNSLNFDTDGSTGSFNKKRGVYNRSHPTYSSTMSLNSNLSDAPPENYEKTIKVEWEIGNEKERVEKTTQELEILQKKDPETIIELLLEKKNTYFNMIEEETDPKLFIIFMDILSKVCCAESRYKGEILRLAILPTFLDKIFLFVEDLPFIDDHNSLEYEPIFRNLIIIYEGFVKFMQSHAQIWHTHLLNAKKSLKLSEKNLNLKLDQNLLGGFNLLIEDILDVPDEDDVQTQDAERPKNKLKKTSYYPEPVGDFRTVSVLPRPEDIYDEQPFLSPNIIDGPYSSIDQYLDTHFKLLREDFVGPIRKAIKDYRKQVKSKEKFKRIENVRIYRRVKFLHSKTIHDKVGYEVCFDVDKKINRVNWEFSNRFMFGSLLLFSNNDFDSFFLGTVANRNVKELENKLLMVELKEVHEAKTILGKEFVMAESEAYFEPYFHVLSALQRLDETNFPLAKYIVKTETETAPPTYLDPMEVLTIRTRGQSYSFRALSDMEWPSSNDLGLDISQYTAYKAALTNDLVVIQGPPGTGKTFLGLKIAQGLLQNRQVWNPSKDCPIFVVCFTNHALDQFLEGLLPVTNKLVRIGGKSKGTELDKFNIRERRREYSYYKRKANFSETRRIQLEMSTLFAKMKQCQTDVQKLEDGEGILSLKTLKLVMNGIQSDYFSSDDQVVDWLLCGIGRNEIDHKVKVTITADGIIREPVRDTVLADSEDDRLKQAFFDAVDLEEVNLTEDEKMVHFAMHLKQIQQQQEQQEKRKQQNKKKHHNPQNNDLGFVLNHLRNELIDNRKVPTELEKLTLLGEMYLNSLKPDERWKLYNTWLDTLKTGLIAELGKIEKEFKDCAYRYEQLRQNDDLQILKSADVVGTTTTIAAKLQPLFELLAPKIVIVEEAAEVLEAHIIASLTRNCQQLILIGDHKQLRPNIAEMRMGRQFALDVSLFERMVINGMACHTLNLQHRMRPEISQQLVPTIYPNLQDDISVFNREPIKGVMKNCFFMTHNHFEDDVTEITSKRNCFEAEVIMKLANYLVQQGYKPQDITILATYKGQMYHMKNEIKRIGDFPKGIQITVVDNFQGEENKIILLSLVRSNNMNKIGFLEIENRVCVALSRARDGLFIVGNMDSLVMSSEIWPHIRLSLLRQQAIGPAIELQCQIHKDQVTAVRCGADFSKVAAGGCSLICNQELSCGHCCKSMCHVNQDYHRKLKCKEPCRKTCYYGHPCPRKCHQSCEDCKVPRRQNLLCGHSAEIPCYMDSRLYECLEIVEVVIPDCTHKVRVACHLRSNPVCDVPCKYRPDCGHSCTRLCHVNDDPDHMSYECIRPCARLNKGCSQNHKCRLKCNEACKPCLEVVEKQLGCGHRVSLPCWIAVETIQCQNKCTRTLSCGHQCPKWCKEPCNPCMEPVDKVVKECKHTVKVPCSEEAQISDCANPCTRYLNCGHLCAQKCQDQCSSKHCTQPKSFKTTYPMLCGHTNVLIPCKEASKVRNENLVDENKHKEYLPQKKDSLSSMLNKTLGNLFGPKRDGNNSAAAVDGKFLVDEELVQFCAAPCSKVLSCEHPCSGTCSECLQGRIHKICDQPCGNVLICGHSCPVPCREDCPPCNKPCSYKCKHSQCAKKCGEVCTPCNEPCDYGCEHAKCTRLCWQLCDREPCYEQCSKLLECGHGCVGFCGEPCPPCRKCQPQHYEEFFGNGEETEEDALWILLEDCNHVFESTCLEYWLNIKQDGKEIVSKACPRCKTPIISVQRYMNVIKTTFNDIQTVKLKCYGQLDEIAKQRQQCLDKFKSITYEPFDSEKEPWELNKLYSTISKGLEETKVKGRKTTRNKVNAHKAQLLAFLTEFFSSIYTRTQEVWDGLNNEAKEEASYQVNFLVKLLMKRTVKINREEMESFERELRRLHRLLDLLIYTSSPHFLAVVSYSPNAPCAFTRNEIKKLLNSMRIYDDPLDNAVKALLGKLKDQIKSSREISPAERAMINKAMSQDFRSSQKTGHWFKCKNNHIYCITECGGAMVEARCPVSGCGEIIGGQNHALRSDQALATEMDGARYAAWSDQNNMANFGNFDD